MGGKTVTIRLNEVELENMESMANKMNMSIGKCIKEAMNTFYFDSNDKEMDRKIRELQRHNNWTRGQAALMQFFVTANQIFKPDFVEWLAEVNDVEIIKDKRWRYIPVHDEDKDINSE